MKKESIIWAILGGTLLFFGGIMTEKLEIAIPAFVIGGMVIFWGVLLKNNWFFTLVEEGTAKIILKAGKISKIVFVWEEHWMDEQFNVWRKEEKGVGLSPKKIKGLFGGIFYIGIPPFWRVHTYPLRWADIHIKNGKREIKFHEEIIDYVLLRPCVYWTKLTKAETKEMIPVDVEFAVTLRIENPYKFCFIAPPTPIEEVLTRLSAVLRARVALLSVEELIGMKGKSKELWEGTPSIPGLEDEKLIQETLPKWGIRLASQGIDILDIALPEEYQEAQAAKRRAQLETEGRLSETVRGILQGWAEAQGKTLEQLSKEIREDKKKKEEILKIVENLILKKLALEKNAYIYMEVEGAGGIEKVLLDLLGINTMLKRSEKNIAEGKWKKV